MELQNRNKHSTFRPREYRYIGGARLYSVRYAGTVHIQAHVCVCVCCLQGHIIRMSEEHLPI